MSNLKNKTVLITGASSGIGAACAIAFAEKGCRLIICARSIDNLTKVKDNIGSQFDVPIFAFQLDVQNKNDVFNVLENLPKEFEKVDILVNNAGLARGFESFEDNLISDWDEMIDTNIKGLLYVTKALIPKMLERNRGDIINIGSIAGVASYPKGAVYCASKSATKFISDGIRQDVVGSALRVCNIQPGLVETNFSRVRFHGNNQKADAVYNGLEALSAKDVADIVVYTAMAPSHVQICEVTVTPTCQATGGVLSR